ncbi:hypothetical protein RR48_11441 [Papilio machaon]|uniref:Uncharacterized protein n=1 Tax=Papilio machaon TaxID=76193 RepID=A0A194QN57_PAPMA|nr:hypothetical protein RR48_11441 [Papilio machaon]
MVASSISSPQTQFPRDLCMINATVIKHSNKKWIRHEDAPDIHRPRLDVVTLEQPGEEPRIEELIQSSNNVVANIDDITLKEPTVPEIQFLINDGFGELRSEMRSPDRTVELMLQGSSVAQLSAIDNVDVSGDKSHDKSRPHTTRELQMERINSPDNEMIVAQHPEPIVQSEAVKRKADDDIILEELEVRSPKRRRARRLIIDQHTRLGPEYMRDRIVNKKIEMRCKSASEDVINIRIPAATYLLRPAHDGHKLRPNIASVFRTLYLRNLEFISKTTTQNRELEEAVVMPAQEEPRSHLQPVEEDPSALAAVPQIELPVQTEVERAEVTMIGQGQGLLDFSDLPTQVVETLSQVRKRTSEFEYEGAKRRRSSGFLSYKQHREQLLSADIAAGMNSPYEQWGTEGTMVKVLRGVREGLALDVQHLVSLGPVLHTHRNIIMARCFTSLLKLKQHGFVNLKKDPDTLCIIDITLGPKFEEVDAE